MTRSRTISRKQQRRDAKAHVHDAGDVELLHELADNRPATRADCQGGERPCPFLSCRYHLYLDINEYGGIRLNFPDIELHQMAETCALDVAERQGATLEHVGSLMNVTRERIRQMETAALQRIARTVEAA